MARDTRALHRRPKHHATSRVMTGHSLNKSYPTTANVAKTMLAGDRWVQDRMTDVLAAGAVVSPWWLPGLKDVSEVVALFLPILGAIWLVVQIWAKIRITFFTTRKTDEKEG